MIEFITANPACSNADIVAVVEADDWMETSGWGVERALRVLEKMVSNGKIIKTGDSYTTA
jgi:hypothetical protein